jgi:hypothetical protein
MSIRDGSKIDDSVGQTDASSSRRLPPRARVGTGENALFAGFVVANDNRPPGGSRGPSSHVQQVQH